MFSSVAVGKLRQAYKSPAITRLGCMFKTRVCVCVYVQWLHAQSLVGCWGLSRAGGHAGC